MGAERERSLARTIVARASLLLLGLVLALLVCEVGFRVVERIRLARAGELWAVYDEKLGWRGNPKFPGHNAEGFHDRPIEAKRADTSRILMLGDSVLYYGDGPEDTVVGRMRPALPANWRDVIDAGVKGYTNWQELEYLKERGLALEPDLVGVGFVLNDCYRMLHQFRVEDGKIVGQEYDFSDEAVGRQPFLERTLRKSRFLVWLRRKLAGVEAPGEAFSFLARPDMRAAWEDAPWTAIEAQMREMKELGEQHGFRVFLVVFPFADQYRPDYLARDRVDVLKPQRKLEDICARLSIPCLDLYPALDAARDFEADRIHLVASGRERAAREIASFLVADGLVESGAPRPR